MQLIIQERQKTCQIHVIHHFYRKNVCDNVGGVQDLLYFCGIKKRTIMCTATITYTKNRREIDLLLSVIKKLGAIVSIDNTDDVEYNPDMVRKVEEGRAAYQRGDYEVLDLDNLWK